MGDPISVARRAKLMETKMGSAKDPLIPAR